MISFSKILKNFLKLLGKWEIFIVFINVSNLLYYLFSSRFIIRIKFLTFFQDNQIYMVLIKVCIIHFIIIQHNYNSNIDNKISIQFQNIRKVLVLFIYTWFFFHYYQCFINYLFLYIVKSFNARDIFNYIWFFLMFWNCIDIL